MYEVVECNTKDIKKTAGFIDKIFGVEFEITPLEDEPNSGTIMVYGLEGDEFGELQEFMIRNNLELDI